MKRSILCSALGFIAGVCAATESPMISFEPPFSEAEWIGHPSLEPVNTPEAEAWIETTAMDRVFSFDLWKQHPEELTAREYAVDKLRGMKPAPRFRREFEVDGEVESATVHFSGLGIGRIYLNGARVGDGELGPRQTQYEKRALYESFDLTNLLRQGDNVLGVELGQGWFSESLAFGNDKHDLTMTDTREALDSVYGEGDKSVEGNHGNEDIPWSYGDPGFILSLEINYADGRTERIVSDASWSAGTGPILKNSIFSGMFHDARRESPGWCDAGFDDSGWTPAAVRDPLSPRLEPMNQPPERRFREFEPVRITEPESGVYVFHFERVFAGWPRLRTSAPTGTLITLRHSSQLDENGNVTTIADGDVTSGTKLINAYVADGATDQTWEPYFTYHSGRYIEVRGLPGPPTPGTLTGIAVATDTEETGTFAASDPLLNRIEDALAWTLKSNIHGTINCMSSRERDHWPVQGILNGRNLMFHYDTREIWRETIKDWKQGNTNTEGFPYNITPSRREFGPMSYTFNAMPIILRDYHAFYGGRDLIEENFDLVAEFLRDGLEAFRVEPGVDLIIGLGDHCDPNLGDAVRKGNIGMAHNSDSTLTASIQYADACRVTAQLADYLGREQEAAEFQQRFEAVRAAILARYYDAEAKTFGSMANNALAVHHGIAPEADTEAILDNIETEIAARGGAFTTGFFGTPPLLFVLSDHGRADTALELMTRTEYPSYGYYLLNYDAHEIWEYWDDRFPGSRPFIGRMQMEKGAAIEWNWRSLGGLRPDFNHPGFGAFTLAPVMPKGLNRAGIEYETGRGTIRSQWQREGAGIIWTVSIPAGSTATLQPIGKDGKDVRLLIDDGEATEATFPLELGGGEYVLEME